MNNIIEFIDKISWEIFSVSIDLLGIALGVLMIICILAVALAVVCSILFAPFIPIIVYNKSKKYYVIKSQNTTTIIKAKDKRRAQIKYYSGNRKRFDIIESIEELEDE